MPHNFRPNGTRSLGCALLLLCTTLQVHAQDGKLVQSSLVQLEDARPHARAILDKVDIRSITYLSDGLKVKGYLAVPKEEKKLPCVIYNRGGSRSFGALNDEEALYLLGRIASWGYVVAASQYRGNAGGEGKEEFGGADVHDVLNLIPLLEALPQADTLRIGMYGWSRGGMMTYLALTRTNRIAAAVIGGGSSDLFDGLERRPDMEKSVYAALIPNYAKDKEAALTARSAIRWPEKINKKTPLLLLHGSADWRVDPTEVLAMVSALYKCKQPVRFVFFEGGDHGLSEYQGEVNRLIKDWLDHYVRDQKPWPSLEPHGD
jgi:dipeptidyl aminopeptidase/acylaminoacyl peptidase